MQGGEANPEMCKQRSERCRQKIRSETHLDRVRGGVDSLKDTAFSLLAAETSSFFNSKVLHLDGLKCPKSKLPENPCPKCTLKNGFSFWVRKSAEHCVTAAMSNSSFQNGRAEGERDRETHRYVPLSFSKFTDMYHFITYYMVVPRFVGIATYKSHCQFFSRCFSCLFFSFFQARFTE